MARSNTRPSGPHVANQRPSGTDGAGPETRLEDIHAEGSPTASPVRNDHWRTYLSGSTVTKVSGRQPH